MGAQQSTDTHIINYNLNREEFVRRRAELLKKTINPYQYNDPNMTSAKIEDIAFQIATTEWQNKLNNELQNGLGQKILDEIKIYGANYDMFDQGIRRFIKIPNEILRLVGVTTYGPNHLFEFQLMKGKYHINFKNKQSGLPTPFKEFDAGNKKFEGHADYLLIRNDTNYLAGNLKPQKLPIPKIEFKNGNDVITIGQNLFSFVFPDDYPHFLIRIEKTMDYASSEEDASMLSSLPEIYQNTQLNHNAEKREELFDGINTMLQGHQDNIRRFKEKYARKDNPNLTPQKVILEFFWKHDDIYALFGAIFQTSSPVSSNSSRENMLGL